MATDLAQFRFTCPLPHGLHARPASLLAAVARRFTSDVRLVAPSGNATDARSVLGIVALDVKQGDACAIEARGADANDAVAALRAFVEQSLPHADDATPTALPDVSSAYPAARLPIALRDAGVIFVAGRPACAGIGIGAAVIVGGLALPPSARDAKAKSCEHESAALRGAIDATRAAIVTRANAARSRLERELLGAHASIVDDPALAGEALARIESGATAAQAVVGACEAFSARLRGATSAYIRDRVVDVHDVCMQLVDRLVEGGVSSSAPSLAAPSVVFAEALTANQLLHLDRRHLRGLVLGHVGATSHTVILARSLGIPTLIDVPRVASIAEPGQTMAVDGRAGFVAHVASPRAQRFFEGVRAAHERRSARLASEAQRPARTRDGAGIEVGANATTSAEVETAIAQGADGIGLLRTEALFLDRANAPTEDEQHRAYAAVVAAAKGKPVIIRTFDIGGDKLAPYIDLPREENPFLGERGLRLYRRHESLLRAQLRAMLRASAAGPIKIMAPMITIPAEAQWFRAQVRAAQDELRGEGIAFDERVPIGAMIEVPALAFALDRLREHVDFVSLGTNDLSQYWAAADRGNATVAPLANNLDPSFVALLRTIADGAKSLGLWIGMCGEMASARKHLPLLVGLGLDEISVAPSEVASMKTAVASLDASRCRAVVEELASCADAAEVERALATCRGGTTRSFDVLAPETIALDADAASKQEAIREAVHLLFAAGRTDDPDALEEAVWAREETYSTGLGFGFAVPHCKSDCVIAPSLAVVTLREPVEWGSMDGAPVRVVILLAVPTAEATGAHMKIFAKLARKLMHEDFRAQLLEARDADAILASLEELARAT